MYFYSGLNIGFDFKLIFFLISNCDFGRNMIIFGVDNTLSIHVDNKKKYILVLGERPT